MKSRCGRLGKMKKGTAGKLTVMVGPKVERRGKRVFLWLQSL
jgi:hypothetical protein